MKRITLFTWGYYGWGNATKQLVKLVDTVEKRRGFLPPIFVDIRVHRSVRAAGFDGNNFRDLLGSDRYVWMKELGNERVAAGGGGIKIVKPSAVNDLLDLATSVAKENRRVIFFCSCPFPKQDGYITCHRTSVATLLLGTARRRRKSIEVVEWPGGAPVDLEIRVRSRESLKQRIHLPWPKKIHPAEVEGPAWGTVATVHSGSESFYRILGPSMWKAERWNASVTEPLDASISEKQAYQAHAAWFRKAFGLLPLRS